MILHTLGPSHPSLAEVWRELGATLASLPGRTRDAAAAYARALDIAQEALGTGHADVIALRRRVSQLQSVHVLPPLVGVQSQVIHHDQGPPSPPVEESPDSPRTTGSALFERRMSICAVDAR